MFAHVFPISNLCLCPVRQLPTSLGILDISGLHEERVAVDGNL